VVFCSKGDNITPPQQALGWILDLYESVDEIRRYGQTIVYAIHDKVGHLGIFVSGGVAKKEHCEFAGNIDMIDVLPPGLYEAVLSRKRHDDPTATFAGGDYIARFEARTLDDLRALGGNDAADERRFATVARISETNRELYRQFVRPWLRAAANEATADIARRLHPARAQYEFFSDRNPLMGAVREVAEQVRAQRRPCAPGNPFLKWQEFFSRQIVAGLDQWGSAHDWLSEQLFLSVYGSPVMQAAVGVGESDPPRRRPGTPPMHEQFLEKRIAELKARIEEGGAREAAIRAMLYVGLGRLSPDERAFTVLRHLREELGGETKLDAFKQLLREQLFMLLIDEKQAFDAIPRLARREPAQIGVIRVALRRVAAAAGPLDTDRAVRLAQVQAALELDAETEPEKADGSPPRRGGNARKRSRRAGERSSSTEPIEA
ncbi:MAG: DUF3141 domain-containing protein, partial [Rhodospirillales bacterium]|nr:DUF3141 domain-containing protein [Rhodospirillales bacterium]